MNQKHIIGLIDVFRAELSAQEGALVAAALVTWQKLSQSHQVTAELELAESLLKSPRDAEKVLAALADHRSATVFREAAVLLSRASQRVVEEALKLAMRMGQQGLLDTYDPSDLVTVVGNERSGPFGLPPEVCDLLVDLAGECATSTEVYLPWDESGQLLGRILKRGSRAAVEAQGGMVSMARLVLAYYEPTPQSHIQVADPIKSPTYLEKGALIRFPITIATPPFGVKVSFDALGPDPFDRFPEKTNSMTVLAIRHVLAQTDGAAIVVVTNSVLFAAGGERRLRKELIEDGRLVAVVALPAGLLPGTAIQFSILVLSNRQRCDRVRLVNCESDRYKEKIAESRNRFKLACIEEIVNLALGRTDGADARWVSREELAENDLNLLPSRYVLDEAMSRVDHILAAYPTENLELQASILRPIPVTQLDEPILAKEVGAADILDSGFIAPPAKDVSVTGPLSRSEDQFLRPFDIVMVIKGSVGKVSIAPADTPAPGPGGWVVGQSMAIVRAKNATKAMALAVFLRSDIGQELIRRLIAGAAIPFLQIRALQQLKVPVLTGIELERAASVLDEQQQVRQELMRLQERLAAIQFSEWQLPKVVRLGLSS